MRIVLALLIIALVFQSCKKDSDFVSDSQNEKINQDSINQVINDTLFEKQSKSIKELYTLFDKELIWTNKENRTALFENIKTKCKEEGLFIENYALPKLLEYEKKREILNYYEFQKYDLLLSKAFKNLANHLHKGTLNPREIYNNWDANYRNPIFNKQIASAIKNKEITSLLDQSIAKHKPYTDLREQLKLHRELPEEAFATVPNVGKIVPFSTSSAMPKIKTKLKYFGYLETTDESTKYDEATVKAIKKFQYSHGLSDDGIIGGGTIAELNTSRDKRIKQILIGLERAKWYPDSFSDKYVYVNIPDMHLVFMYEGDTIDKKKVVIGTLKRKTPVLSSRIGNIVFYPTWTLPPTIVKEDLKKDATHNKNYFNSMRITIKDGKGNEINPKDWDSIDAHKYKYIQAPGYNNALGLVKFNFHNKFSVYLHDTNHREYFSKSNRALSSGCVRIENPLDFTKKMLMKEDEEKWKEGEIDSVIKRGNTKTIYLNNSIKIYQFYHTAWAQYNVLHTRKDVYNYDNELYEKLRNQSILK